jgi:hypothetical protein
MLSPEDPRAKARLIVFLAALAALTALGLACDWWG